MSGIVQGLIASFKSAAAAADEFFNRVTLLLNTSSTNGAQNNTFLDSSTNNFTITRNGNTTQGTFTPFSQTGWGVSNTITQYCQLNNSDFSISTGDFTVELWMYCTDDSTYSATNFCSAPSNPNFTFGFGSGTSGARFLYLEYGGGATTNIGSAMSNYLNRWVHVAVVRQSGTVTSYLNGTSLGSVSKSAAAGSTANLYLLRNSGDTGQDFRGFISNFRFCKSAVYTSNFTPSTIPLTTTSQSATNCVLLTFQDNRFKDNSTTAATVTPTSTAIQAFSPFAPTAAYDAAVVGGSGYFDGSGDYLTTPSSTNLALGTGAFTVEAWFYGINNTDGILSSIDSGSGSYGLGFYFASTTSIKIAIQSNSVEASGYTATVAKNSWTHIAASRDGSGNYAVFANGVRIGNTTNSTNISLQTWGIGRTYSNSGSSYNGHIAGVRIVKGSAVYDPTQSTLTLPTAPPTAVTNTQLLLNSTNAGIFDSAAKNILETVGNAQVSTTQAKWGTTSMYFDGTGDYLTSASKPVFDLGKGDWTIEFWINPTAPSVAAGIMTRINFAGNTGWGILYYPNYLTFVIGSGSPSIQSATNSITAGSWQHVAITRSGTSGKIFINGTQSGSTGTINDFTDASTLLGIGALSTVTGWNGDYYLTGYIDDLRITKGYARYTANFTAPTAAFPLQ
jgi:hypothetical protein